jgi:hypothetical protein
MFSHRVTPVFAVVVGCLIPVPGAAVTSVLWCICCSFFSGRPTLHSACGSYVEVLVKWDMKIIVLWDVTTCSLVNRYQRLGGTYCTCLQGRMAPTLKMEAERFSEMSVTIYQT